METYVVALGGNALLGFGEKPTYETENKNALRAARSMVPLLKRKVRLVITHGNGPQVGDELLRGEFAKSEIPKFPLHVLNAETQASIGTMLELAIRSELARAGLKRDIATVLTHVVVDRKDHAFTDPTKPIGPFYTKAKLNAELKKEKFDFISEEGKYRRVVASPKPLAIVEVEAIKRLTALGTIVIASGGGGIPVFKDGNAYSGAKAVIDKDRTAQLLATSMGASRLIILTNVGFVYRDYGRKRLPIRAMNAAELSDVLGTFERGTMRPKLEACLHFVQQGGKKAYIGDLFRLDSVLSGKTGTTITKV